MNASAGPLHPERLECLLRHVSAFELFVDSADDGAALRSVNGAIDCPALDHRAQRAICFDLEGSRAFPVEQPSSGLGVTWVPPIIRSPPSPRRRFQRAVRRETVQGRRTEPDKPVASDQRARRFSQEWSIAPRPSRQHRQGSQPTDRRFVPNWSCSQLSRVGCGGVGLRRGA